MLLLAIKSLQYIIVQTNFEEAKMCFVPSNFARKRRSRKTGIKSLGLSTGISYIIFVLVS
jgi:hypothetical protein